MLYVAQYLLLLISNIHALCSPIFTVVPRSLALRVEAGPNKKTGHKQI